jgi:hypothetical protein
LRFNNNEGAYLMKSQNGRGLKERSKKGILTDRDVQLTVDAINGMFSPEIRAMIQRFGVDPENVVRFSTLASHCRKRRMELGWEVKEAARKLGLPDYRVQAIESGSQSEMTQVEIRLYVDLLGVGEWFEKWRKANRQAFASLPEYPDRDTPWARKLSKVKQPKGRKKS